MNKLIYELYGNVLQLNKLYEPMTDKLKNINRLKELVNDEKLLDFNIYIQSYPPYSRQHLNKNKMPYQVRKLISSIIH